MLVYHFCSQYAKHMPRVVHKVISKYMVNNTEFQRMLSALVFLSPGCCKENVSVRYQWVLHTFLQVQSLPIIAKAQWPSGPVLVYIELSDAVSFL